MATAKFVQNVLNGGELSPLVAGRVDLPRYKTGAHTMRNAIPLPLGGVTRRPGTIFAGEAAHQGGAHGTVRFIPFIYDGGQHRMLEIYPGGMRVWYANGTRVLSGGAPYSLVLPYTGADIPTLTYAQSADVIYIACRNRPPAKISRYGDTDWRYKVLTFVPSIATPAAPTLTPQGSVPGTGSQTYAYRIVAVDGETGELSLPSPSREVTTETLSATWNIRLNWTAVAGATEYRVFKRRAGLYGFIGRAVGGALQFVDNNITPDSGDTPAEAKNPFTGADAYPTVTFFHQQRLGWAASNKRPLTVWLSQSANFENLSASIPPKDDDGMEATFAGQRQSRILWCVSGNKALCIGTNGGELLMDSASGAVFSPNNHGFSPQGEVGSQEGIGAIKAGDSLVFIQRGGTGARLFVYDVGEDKYVSNELSILAGHILFGKQVESWCWQAVPHGIVWLALSDGTLAGLTLLPKHDVIGWHRHDTDGFIEHAATLPAMDGGQDLLWLVVERTIGGAKKRYIEIMAPYFFSAGNEEAYFVDCGISAYGAAMAGTAGLSHLEGKTVAGYTDGFVQPPMKVAGGAVTFDRPVAVAHVGLPYSTELTPTVPEAELADGASMGRLRRPVSVKLRVYETLVASIQTGSSGRFAPVSLNQTMFTSPLEETPTFTKRGDIDITIGEGWQSDPAVTIRVDAPTPFTCLAMVTQVEISSGAKGHQR